MAKTPTKKPDADASSTAAKPKTKARVRAPRVAIGYRGPKWLRRFGGYFKGSWQELRQVRWPNRAATWSLTGAVIAFSVFFAIFILSLDTLFNYLFKEVF